MLILWLFIFFPRKVYIYMNELRPQFKNTEQHSVDSLFTVKKCSYFYLNYLLGHVLGVGIISVLINTLVTLDRAQRPYVDWESDRLTLSTRRFPTLTPGGLLPIMAYTGRLRPKGVPFSGLRYKKG